MKPNRIHDDSRIQEPKKNPGSRAYSLTHDKAGNRTDNLNKVDKTTRRYIGAPKGGTGIWQNSQGVQLGRSLSEDSDIMPMKSTGDIPASNLGSAIHIHLHTLPDFNADYRQAARLKNKQKGK
jgi:hypothetical protein